jgi:hypothetical protein
VSGLSATRQLLVGKQFIAGQSSNAKRQIIGSQVRAPVAAYFWKQVAAFIHYQQQLPEKANPLFVDILQWKPCRVATELSLEDKEALVLVAVAFTVRDWAIAVAGNNIRAGAIRLAHK